MFKVIDLFGQYDEDTTTVNVVDTTPPTVTAPPNPCAGQKDGVCECTGPRRHARGYRHGDGDGRVRRLTGPHERRAAALRARDDHGQVDRDRRVARTRVRRREVVKVADRTPPTLTVTLSPTVLWPPDHKLIPITATIAVSDTCDPEPDGDAGLDHEQRARQRPGRRGHDRGISSVRPPTLARSCSARSEAEGKRADLHGHLPSHGRQRQHHNQDGHRDRPEESGGQPLDRAVGSRLGASSSAPGRLPASVDLKAVVAAPRRIAGAGVLARAHYHYRPAPYFDAASS